MKLKSFLKLTYKAYKKCGDVDIEFYDSKGNDIELESIGHFNFVMDVTMTFKKVETEKKIPICCLECWNFSVNDNSVSYCELSIIFPTNKQSCKHQDIAPNISQ